MGRRDRESVPIDSDIPNAEAGRGAAMSQHSVTPDSPPTPARTRPSTPTPQPQPQPPPPPRPSAAATRSPLTVISSRLLSSALSLRDRVTGSQPRPENQRNVTEAITTYQQLVADVKTANHFTRSFPHPDTGDFLVFDILIDIHPNLLPLFWRVGSNVMITVQLVPASSLSTSLSQLSRAISNTDTDTPTGETTTTTGTKNGKETTATRTRAETDIIPTASSTSTSTSTSTSPATSAVSSSSASTSTATSTSTSISTSTSTSTSTATSSPITRPLPHTIATDSKHRLVSQDSTQSLAEFLDSPVEQKHSASTIQLAASPSPTSTSLSTTPSPSSKPPPPPGRPPPPTPPPLPRAPSNAATSFASSRSFPVSLLSIREFYYLFLYMREQRRQLQLIRAQSAHRATGQSDADDTKTRSPIEEDVDVCSICLEHDNEIVLSCSHGFCVNCIRDWHVKDKTCPICRSSSDVSATSDDSWLIMSPKNSQDPDLDMSAYVRSLVLFPFQYCHARLIPNQARNNTQPSQVSTSVSAQTKVSTEPPTSTSTPTPAPATTISTKAASKHMTLVHDDDQD